MNLTDQQRLTLGIFILAMVSGLLCCLAIGTVLLFWGVPFIEAFVFACLGGFTIACFVWIERRLTELAREDEHLLDIEIEQRAELHSQFYAESLACLVCFDAGTLIIEQASPGFVKLMRMGADSNLKGQGLDCLLGVSPVLLESVVDRIKGGDAVVEPCRLEMKTPTGLNSEAWMNGRYHPGTHLIEAALFVPPVQDAERTAELESVRKDLDRFRRGMFRRETRILELKEEVNQLCRQARIPVRYDTDRSSDDSRLRLRSVDLDGMDRGEAVSSNE